MLLALDSTTRKLQAKMASTATTTNCSVTCTYADSATSTFTEGIYPSVLNGTTLVDILPAPAASTRRVVKSINVFNNDTVTHTVTIYLNDNSTSYAIKKITLTTGASWASDDVSVEVAIPEGDKGDITVSSGGTVWTIDAGAVSTSNLGGDITTAGKALLDDATAADQRTTLGLGTIATQNSASVSITGGSITGITDLAVADGGTGASTQQAAINALAGSVTSGQYLRGNGSNVVMAAIQAADVPTLNQNTTGTASNVTGTVAVANGGTGLTTTPSNGQIDIGNGTGFARTTLTAGSNITITNGSGSITIATTAAGVTNGDKGDITVSGSGSDVWTIDSGVVSNAKLATMSVGEIKARVSGSGGSPEDATITQVLDLTGGGTQGSVLYRGSSSWAALGPGTSGQVLQTQGAGANPIWGTRGGQNRLINGDFSVSQRTKPGSTVEYTNSTAFRNLGGAYTHDRWFVMSSSATSNTLSTNIRVAQGTPNIAGSTNAPSGTSCILQGTGAVVSKFGIAQILESTLMPQLAGKTVTLSFQAKASEATPTQVKNICAAVINVAAPTYPSRLFVTTWGAVDTGPSAYASGHTALATSRALLSGTWTNYSVTATVGATEPANLIAFIWVETVTGSSVNESVYIQDVQLETGAVPTAFERLSYDENLLRCQRYFYAKYGIAGQNTVYGSGNWNTVSTANPFEASVPLPVQMRVSPTVRFAPRVLKAGTTNATTTTTGFNSSATTIPVAANGANAFPDIFPGYIQVGSEVMSYAGKTASSFTGVTRGVDSSYPASAASGAQVTEVATPLLSSQFTIFPSVNPNLTTVTTYVRLLNIGASPSLPASREIKVLVSRNAKVNFPGSAPAPAVSGPGELRDAGNGLSFIAADAEI